MAATFSDFMLEMVMSWAWWHTREVSASTQRLRQKDHSLGANLGYTGKFWVSLGWVEKTLGLNDTKENQAMVLCTKWMQNIN